MAAPPRPHANSLLALARRPMLMALVLLAAAAAVGLATQWRHDQALLESRMTRDLVQQASGELAAAEEARARLEANLRQFEILKRGGFVGEPDRVGLLEALERGARGMPNAPLRWEIRLAETLEAVNDPKTGQPVADVRALPMMLQADAVHEGEWLGFLQSLRTAPQGQLRIQSCDLRQGVTYTAAGQELPSMGATCELRWIYVQPPAKPAGS